MISVIHITGSFELQNYGKKAMHGNCKRFECQSKVERQKELNTIECISDDEDITDFKTNSVGHVRTAPRVLHKIDEKLRKGLTPMAVHL